MPGRSLHRPFTAPSGAMNGMETYNGHVRTPADAIILFEACRIGLLPRVQRRLSEKERQSIKSGSVFVWDEREAGMRRWTDGKSWSASRVSGSFLTYREMEGKRGGSSFDKAANRDGAQGQEADSDGGPDGYRYKPDGLMKQSFSITTNQGQHLHLISYYSRSTSGQNLLQPTNDPQLRHIRPEKGMYPDSTVHEQSSIPAVTRGPMNSPAYTHAPNQSPPYARGPYYPHTTWAPPSPMHTPPPNSGYSPYYTHPPQGQYPTHSPLQTMHYPPPTSYGAPSAMTAFDRPPAPMSSNGLPPPPPPPHASAGYSQPPQPYAHPPPPPPPSQHSYPASYPPPPAPYHNTYSYAPPSMPAPPAPYPAAHYPPPSAAPEIKPAYPDHPPSTTTESQSVPLKDDRQDSHHGSVSSEQQSHTQAGAQAAPTSSGQTIPSISAMLNGGGENGAPPQRTSSRSPGGTAHTHITDIPSHKLGFEVTRDVQALRNLDKSTFKY